MTGQRGKGSSAKGSRSQHGVDKIREIILHLQKVDSVVMEVRDKLNELENWKLKLEENLYAYLNGNNKSHDGTMNSPINLGHSGNRAPLYHGSMTTHTDVLHNGFNPNNNNNPNNYGGGDFNPEQLLGLSSGSTQNNNRNGGWRIPNIPSTSGLLTPGGHFPDSQNNNNNNTTTTSNKAGNDLMVDTPKMTKERAATLKIIRTKIQQVYDSEECKSKYKCTDCLKTFDKWPNASKHIRLIHLREQRHKCPVCARDFYDKRSALAHQNTCGADSRRDQLMHK